MSTSYSQGIDDAVLLMASVVFKKIPGFHCSVISNDNFNDYQYGTRLNFNLIDYENTLAYWNQPHTQEWARRYPREAAKQKPKLPKGIPKQLRSAVVAAQREVDNPSKARAGGLQEPSMMRQVSIPGEQTTKEKFRPRISENEIVVVDSNEKNAVPLVKNSTFTNETFKLLQEKLKNNSKTYETLKAFNNTVARLCEKILRNKNPYSNILYILDFENMLYDVVRSNDIRAYVERLHQIFTAFDYYIQRRWRGQVLINNEGRYVADWRFGVQKRVTLIIPMYRNRSEKFGEAFAIVYRERLTRAFFDVLPLNFSIDFFNEESDKKTSAAKVSSAPTKGTSIRKPSSTATARKSEGKVGRLRTEGLSARETIQRRDVSRNPVRRAPSPIWRREDMTGRARPRATDYFGRNPRNRGFTARKPQPPPYPPRGPPRGPPPASALPGRRRDPMETLRTRLPPPPSTGRYSSPKRRRGDGGRIDTKRRRMKLQELFSQLRF